MTQTNTYPYRVKYRRTVNWYNHDWGELSTWCNETFNKGEWDYYNNRFVFKHEVDCSLFILRWL